MSGVQIRLRAYNYKFYAEHPMTALNPHHRRLSLYVAKGTTCAKCGIVGTRLITGIDCCGNKHMDVYTEDLQMAITVGHIIPKSHGGESEIFNLRPLCLKCNTKEGAGFDHLLRDLELFDQVCKGRWVNRKNGNNFQNGKPMARVQAIFRSARDNKIYFGFEGGFTYKAIGVKFIPKQLSDKYEEYYYEPT